MTTAVINLLKPPGMTSHDVVAFVRRLYRQKKVGHSGTLDPAAAGVLPVYLGQATRLVEYADEFDKSYRAEIIFGITTDTGDDTGTTLVSRSLNPGALDGLKDAVESFAGGYEQIPPMYSALKINGKKLYELAREGIEVERTARWIQINEIQLLWQSVDRATIQVTCSKGTYIRTLCADIGDKLHLPATMGFLLRTHVGPFALNQAHTLEEITADPQGVLLPADIAVGHLASCRVDANEARLLQQGQAVVNRDESLRLSRAQLVRLYDNEGIFFGMGQLTCQAGMLQPIKIFADGIKKNVDN